MRAVTPEDSRDVLQDAKYVLFVEGNRGGDSFDRDVLRALLEGVITVKTLGASMEIEKTAKVLFEQHASYFFVIDRDHRTERYVESTWANFPDPAKHNLLIWRRKELENYFLDPEWLLQSEHIKPGTTVDAIAAWITAQAQERLCCNVADLIMSELIHNVRNFKHKSLGIVPISSAVLSLDELQAAIQSAPFFDTVRGLVDDEQLSARLPVLLRELWDDLTGGADTLAWGVGAWRDRMSLKAVLTTTLDKFTVVHTRQGELLTGARANTRVCEALVKGALGDAPAHPLPEDLSELRDMINRRVVPPPRAS